MRLLHYLEIRNFKRFGDTQRIELDHPAVLIGPNNCGKTTAIQAVALWSQAVRAWQEKKGQAPPKERTSTSLNRLGIVSVPVQRTRYFWHNAAVRTGNRDIHLQIKVGVLHESRVEAVTMTFRNQGEDLVYCTPDPETLERREVIRTAAGLKVELLYPMSGLETEEPVLQRGRIDVLLGQGQTAQVLRNRGYVLYVEGSTDVEILRALARKIGHAAEPAWDERINSCYVQDNFPDGGLDAELARVEGGFGLTPQRHFFALRSMVPELRGLALPDSDGRDRTERAAGGGVLTRSRR